MRPLLTVALMGMAFMIVPGAHASRELSLSQGFRTCVAVRDVGLMSDLMRTVWDLPFRKSGAFEKEHGSRIKTGTLTQSRLGPLDSSMASTEARVELSGQDKLLGIPARAVSAVTCEEGCGISVWELEFGKLSLSDIRRLRTWVRAAPKTAWDMDPGSPIAVQLVVRATGEVSLVCDIST